MTVNGRDPQDAVIRVAEPVDLRCGTSMALPDDVQVYNDVLRSVPFAVLFVACSISPTVLPARAPVQLFAYFVRPEVFSPHP